MNDGDWICGDPNCGNINFSRRVSCYRCNKEKPESTKTFKKKLGTEIGKVAAEKSRGLFNADDWQCNKCTNVNWAKRQTCNVCNAPRYGEVEARTGYGGGYNERGVVEYRRREPSSDDEYDEFGRKKRKRKEESQEKVGITEGAVFKKLPPTVLQKDLNKEHVMPVCGNVMSRPKARTQDNVNGSISDGSLCDISPLTKAIISKHNTEQDNQGHQAFYKTLNKSNGIPTRKRFVSSGDKDQTASSGYDSASKKSRRDSTVSPVIKPYSNPVMENMVSSTNNDVVYKFSGPTPAENYQVTYTLEERVRTAAFAIVYNNCKISTDKFEAMYDKPAPDFKTIFIWRQRLLSTGCLLDSHLDSKKEANGIPPVPPPPISTYSANNQIPKTDDAKTKVVSLLPNPDEIVIPSDTDEEVNDNTQEPLRRSISAETLILPDRDNQAPGSSASTGERRSRERSNSESTHRGTHSSSRDSQDSNYPDTDSERVATKSVTSKTPSCSKSANLSGRPSNDSNSDSVSYNSDEDNFLSRVFPNREGRKKRKVKRRPAPIPPPTKVNSYIPIEIPAFEGYSTIKPTTEQSPLVTGNIYTSNLRNMNVRPRTKIPVDIDTCSSEYVPTKLGSSAKKNYQEFKDNVRRKGYWAKGNGASIGKNRHSISTDVVPTQNTSTMKSSTETMVSNYCTNVQSYNMQSQLNRSLTTDFTKDDINETLATKQYLPFEPVTTIPSENKLNLPKPVHQVENTVERTDRVFAIVQGNSAAKNKSIMDIFDSDLTHKSPEREKQQEHDNLCKRYESVWDEDDDALYKSTDDNEKLPSTHHTPSPSPRPDSPMSNMLYTAEHQIQTNVTPNKAPTDVIKDKQDMLLDLLKDFKNQDIGEILSPLKSITPQKQTTSQSADEAQIRSNEMQTNMMNNLYSIPIPIQTDLNREILSLSSEQINSDNEDKYPKHISSSKKVHIIESVTIQPGSNYEHEIRNRKTVMHCENSKSAVNSNVKIVSPVQNIETNKEPLEKPSEKEVASIQPVPQLDLSNLLAGINTNNLLLALQNLQQLAHNSSSDETNLNSQESTQQSVMNEDPKTVETINLTNDEEWEKESNVDVSIERQLEIMDGAGDTPFLGDIFDPSPVLIPPNIARKLNLDVNNPEEQLQDVDENVIGNFKSFALPKPILLNRLKLTVKTTDKSSKKSSGRVKRKKKTKSGSSQEAAEGGEEDDEEESGDEADLSKYDLWGSDAEQGNSSKSDNVDKEKKDGENSKESESKSPTDKNDNSSSPSNRSSKRRSRSSSSSSSSSSTSSSSHSSTQSPKNRFDDFNLNSERETSPKGRKSRSRSRSPRPRSASRRKSRDSRSAGESRSHESSRDKEWSRDRERRDRSRGNRDERKERRYSRDGNNHYTSRGRHR